MTQYKLKKTKTEESIMNAYKRMEERIVASYFTIENSVVGAYKKIEDDFVEHFLEKVEDTNENEDADAEPLGR
jgi:hypothetical protein